MEAALAVARSILAGFDRHYRIFRKTSQSAKDLFERREWTTLREASRSRIDMYDARVLETVSKLGQDHPAAADESIWPDIKRHYISLIYGHQQPELAETFFNSVATKVLHNRYQNNKYIFTKPAVATEHIDGKQATYRCYYPRTTGLRTALSSIVSDYDLKVPFHDQKRCVENLIQAIRKWMPERTLTEPNFHIQMLSSLFYRNKAAYAVGCLINGHKRELFVAVLVHDSEGGLKIDAFLHEHEHLANLFSVSHSYFMVDMEVPSAWVEFLHLGLPEKPKAELYTAVGLQKQGKTLFFRDLIYHLNHSADNFVIAPGQRGMVMLVFTLPSFPFVFKIIRDYFSSSKQITREGVIEKYRLVKMHDRVGRMADTLEYSNVAFPLARFDKNLLEEMKRLISQSFEIEGDTLYIKHMYIEQRLTPVDLYFEQVLSKAEKGLEKGMREFGQAWRDLAVTNIFPGDLLPKNFGISQYGRVLFYDYDEVCYMTECNFRAIPEARSYEDELRSEPWYSVGPDDVFPEEFQKFLFGSERLKEAFLKINGDLLDPKWWSGIQEGIRAGVDYDLYPYPPEARFTASFHPHDLNPMAE